MAIDPAWGVIGGFIAGIAGGVLSTVISHAWTGGLDRRRERKDRLLSLRFHVLEIYDAWRTQTAQSKRDEAWANLNQAWKENKSKIGDAWYARLKDSMKNIEQAVAAASGPDIVAASLTVQAILRQV